MSDRADDGARERARPLLAGLTMQYDSLDQDHRRMKLSTNDDLSVITHRSARPETRSARCYGSYLVIC